MLKFAPFPAGAINRSVGIDVDPLPSVRLATSAPDVSEMVYVPGAVMHTWSAADGAPLLQLAASVQLPPEAFVHESVHAGAVACAHGSATAVATSRRALTIARPGVEKRRRRRAPFGRAG